MSYIDEEQIRKLNFMKQLEHVNKYAQEMFNRRIDKSRLHGKWIADEILKHRKSTEKRR